MAKETREFNFFYVERRETMEEGEIDNKIKLGPQMITLNIRIVDGNLLGKFLLCMPKIAADSGRSLFCSR